MHEFDAKANALRFVPSHRVGDFHAGAWGNPNVAVRAGGHRLIGLAGAAIASPQDVSADVGPGTGRAWIRLMLVEAPIEFSGEFGRERDRLVRRLRGDRVPEVLDELQALRDGQLPQVVKVDGTFSHGGKVAANQGLGKPGNAMEHGAAEGSGRCHSAMRVAR
jgi:hypothetical protein